MQLHHLIARSGKTLRRIGRGGKRGTYSGRGIKGLGARAGGKYRPQERETLKKIPKLRGYHFRSHQRDHAIVHVDTLADYYQEGEVVSQKTLIAKGILNPKIRRPAGIKILMRGACPISLRFKGVSFSGSAAHVLKQTTSSRE